MGFARPHRVRFALLVSPALLAAPLVGCAHFQQHKAAHHAAAHGQQPTQHTLLPHFRRRTSLLIDNPMLVPVMEREFVWNQVVDTVDNYFQIEREERVRQLGGILTEGRIDTFPTVGSTVLEPWRRDSTFGFERWHSTFQSIRRRAIVRVIPTEAAFLVEVVVLKELEDLSNPEFSPIGGATLRHDGTVVRTKASPRTDPVTLGWIPLGRDISLEQQILAEIQSRLNDVGPLDRLPPLKP